MWGKRIAFVCIFDVSWEFDFALEPTRKHSKFSLLFFTLTKIISHRRYSKEKKLKFFSCSCCLQQMQTLKMFEWLVQSSLLNFLRTVCVWVFVGHLIFLYSQPTYFIPIRCSEKKVLDRHILHWLFPIVRHC